MRVEARFDARSSTLTYVIWDEETRDAVIVDPVLDYDANKVATSDASVLALLDVVAEHGLKVAWILESHVHADHMSGAHRLREALGAPVAISARVREVQAFFAPAFEMDLSPDGSQFQRLVADGDTLPAGGLAVQAFATPGHTPACVTWKIGDALFTGDTLFMPDFGTGRCDFPGGSASDLWDSVQRLYRTFPDDTAVYVGHDYQPGGRKLQYVTTVGEQKRSNKQLRPETARDEFVAWRRARDAALALPNLLYPSLQVNIAAGRLPEPGPSGRRSLRLPMGLFGE
jgi:glyoxylase-like metal-dependent hydrolase (beta-lactamase superfamily II)